MMIGRLKGIAKDLITQEDLVTFSCAGNNLDALSKYEGKKLTIDVKQFREKRSLRANGYYWMLVNKIADAMQVSSNRVHNTYLGDCRFHLILDGEPLGTWLKDTDEAYNEAMEKEDLHLAPTSKTKDNHRLWVFLKGSSDFDSKEMARLIDFAVEDAKQLGIETIPQEEIDRLIEQYGKERGE